MQYLSDVTVLEDKYLTVNFKVAGAVLKQNVNRMKASLESLSGDDLKKAVAAVEAGEQVTLPGWDETFDSSLFQLATRTKEGIVSAEFNNGQCVVALDTKLTDELVLEGVLRDVVRQCQLIRKEAGYEVEQRVCMALSSDSETVMRALNDKTDYLKEELLADSVVFNAPLQADLEKEVEIAGSKVKLAVCKA